MNRGILWASGAGASQASKWMRAWRDRLATLAHVETFDYSYLAAGKRRPDPLPVLIETHREALARSRVDPKVPWVLAGKSMGSRIGCHVSRVESVAALVCFGYPLRAAGSGKLRDAILVELEVPILFLSGTRDPLCPLEDLARVRERMTAPSTLYVVEGGDHSLEVGKRDLRARGLTQEAVDAAVLDEMRRFLERYVPAAGPVIPQAPR